MSLNDPHKNGGDDDIVPDGDLCALFNGVGGVFSAGVKKSNVSYQVICSIVVPVAIRLR